MVAPHFIAGNRGYDLSKGIIEGVGCIRAKLFFLSNRYHGHLQEVSCVATGGSFTLTFDGSETDSIPYDADEAALTSALEEISTIYNVVVEFLNGASRACHTDPSDSGFQVTFLEVPNYRGDVPLMTFDADDLEVGILHNPKHEENLSAIRKCEICVGIDVSRFVKACVRALCILTSSCVKENLTVPVTVYAERLRTN